MAGDRRTARRGSSASIGSAEGAPGRQVAEHLGLWASAVARQALRLLGREPAEADGD